VHPLRRSELFRDEWLHVEQFSGTMATPGDKRVRGAVPPVQQTLNGGGSVAHAGFHFVYAGVTPWKSSKPM
jgi:hypothetical protein